MKTNFNKHPLNWVVGHINDGRKLFGGYRITPKFCRASKTLPRSDPRSHGPTICMFNHECTQRQGEVVGACMDGFLFGACCQLHGEIDTPLVDEQDIDHPQSNLAAALSYESYGNQQTYQSNGNNYNEIKLQDNSMKQVHRPSTNNKYGGIIKNNVYASSIDDDSNISSSNIQSNDIYMPHTNANKQHDPDIGFYVENDSVIVSSPAPEYSSTSAGYYPTTTTPSSTAHDFYLPPSTGTSPQEAFSDELPTLIPTGPYGSLATAFTSDAFNQISESMLNSQSSDFTHSGITHPGVDSIIVEEGTYGEPVYVSTERLSTTSSSDSVQTTLPQKVTYAKPAFKPKPTKNNQNNYVLVQTIDNEKPPKHGSMSENDIESIESIILMLNDTKTGPQYSTDSSTEPNNAGSSYYDTTYGSSSTSAIDYNKYGQSSYYITTKLPSSTSKAPSTSYVYSPEPTKRPISVQSTIASSYGAVTPDINSEHISAPSSTVQPPVSDSIHKKPVLITASSYATTKLPSTSYVTGSPSTNRPTEYADDNIVVTATSHRPTTTAYKKPTKAKIPPSNKVTTKNPPSTSYVTGSTTQRPKATTPKKPSTSYVYSTTQTRRPTTTVTKKGTKNKLTTISPSLIGSSYGNAVTTERIPEEHVVQSKPLSQQPFKDNLGTEIPSPTVLITPKPTVNLITSSTWTQKPNLVTKYTQSTKQPSTSYVYSPIVTYRPTAGQSTTPGYISSGYGSSTQSYLSSPSHSASGISASGISGPEYSSPPHRLPISNDFYDSGYYGQSSTHRPNLHQTYSTSSGYGVYENDEYNSIAGSSTSYPGFLGATQSYGPNGKHPIEYSTIHEEYYTSPNDLNNFPPVRNPNLNMSAAFGTGITVDDYDISTPDFVEDQVLNDKMGLLVSKIVESLQGNFDELADVVYEEKNTTVLSDTAKPSVTKRPSATTKKPIQKATTTKRPVSTRPGTTIARPGNTNTKPGATTKKPATRATTRKPTVASQTNTRRTTKKPTTIVTKKPTVTRITTTRRPTTKPTKKQIQTTTVQQDEDVDIDDEGDEENIGEEEETTTLGEGRLQCGVRPQVKSGRIVGGKGATFGEFPWQVLVRESTWLGLFTKNKCGGVLITKNYVMTAAHCQPGFLASLVAVFGEFDISGDLETKRSVTKNVKRVVVHREYDAATFENDLALLELESPIHYDTHIVPICMPPNMADFTGRMATVTGWGRLKYGGGVPSVLQEVQVPIIENSVCQEMFHTAGHNKKILPSFLCAGYANGQKDSCEGDSGGPLVLQRGDGRWELAGTVSHGIKCAAPYLPGVYMRTTYYKPWLESVTGVH